MARIFRKVRRILIKKSDFKQYLLYAIGEILLIIPGIFIALQLDNMKEVKKNKKKEHIVLLSLLKDFQANIATLDSSITAYTGYMGMIENSMRYIGSQGHQLSAGIKDTILNSAKHIHTNLVEGTINSVLTTDKLELLENEYLKNLLTAYPAQVDSFYDTQNKAEFIILNRHRPTLEQYLALSDMFSESDPKYNTIKTKGVKSDYTGLMQSLKYQNVLIDRFNMENDLLKSARLIRSRTKKILDLLDREIAGG